MFRLLLTTSLIALSAPAFADTFTAEARVDTVTLYPGLAKVSRLLTINMPAGQHEIIVPGLPQGLASAGLRLAATDGAQIGAVNLAYDRLPVTPDVTSPEIQAAKDVVEQMEDALRQRDAAIAQIRLRVQAAEGQIAFLQSMSQASAGDSLTASTITDIQALAQMVGAETLALRQAAFTAEQEAQAAERAREDDVDALRDAQRALDALMAPEQDGSVLTFTLDAATAGEVTIDVSTMEGYANWSPVYDVRLTTGDAPTVDIDRSVVVSQQTGQDWVDVKLVLSTARPGEQVSPSDVWAYPRRIVSEEELERRKTLYDAPAALASPIVMMEDAQVSRAGAQSVQATTDFSGAAVTYTYPGLVTIRNGVDDLRMPLDTLSFDADVWAEAAPSRDAIAYRVAEFTNTSPEVLLPGEAMIFADSTMVGFGSLPLLAAGVETAMGFGPLDGIVLTRTTPNRTEGDRGVFSSSNQLTEQAVMTVENLTGQDWDVLLRDAVPYSEQDDLKVDITATPSVTRTAPENQRGILEWDLSVPSGEKQEVTLNYMLTWPSGYVLE